MNKKKIYCRTCVNYWIFFNWFAFCLIDKNERYPCIIKWNKRFKRLKIGDKIELTFGVSDHLKAIPKGKIIPK